jgi:hypothetical protein
VAKYKKQNFSMTSRKSFLDQGKGKILILMPFLDYFKDLQNKGLPVIREALMSETKECARNSIVTFTASRGWCDEFMTRGGGGRSLLR